MDKTENKIKIKEIFDIDWNSLWNDKLEAKHKEGKSKDWNKAAVPYRKLAKKDNYNEKLLANLILDSEDSLLDIGCGEGSVTVPISKKVAKVTAIDSADKMLEILNERAEKENINNIKTIKGDINEISLEKYGHHDIILASRAINGMKNINEIFKNLNEIANKYVFLTTFGPNNWKIEKDFYKYINKEYQDAPLYTILVNILAEMDIYANVVNLDVGPIRTYKNIDEATNNGKWKLNHFTSEEQEKLIKYLNITLEKDEKTGILSNPYDKPDWVLIWWKVAND